MNPAIINAAFTIAATALGLVAGWMLARPRIAAADAELLRVTCKLNVVTAELADIKRARHNAAVKGAQTKRAMRIDLNEKLSHSARRKDKDHE